MNISTAIKSLEQLDSKFFVDGVHSEWIKNLNDLLGLVGDISIPKTEKEADSALTSIIGDKFTDSEIVQQNHLCTRAAGAAALFSSEYVNSNYYL